MSRALFMSISPLRTALCAWLGIVATTPMLACTGSEAGGGADLPTAAAPDDTASDGADRSSVPSETPAAADIGAPAASGDTTQRVSTPTEPSGAEPATEPNAQSSMTPLDPTMAAEPSAAGGEPGTDESEGGVTGEDSGDTASGDPSAAEPGAEAPVSVPVEPPVSDTASALPVARQQGFTTDANIIYGPLPEQRLDVLYPPTAGPGGTEKLPGVIMFHGGGWIQGDKATMASFYSRFLAHGFIVATAEYRVASQGIAPAAVEDALLAAKWLWDHADYYNMDRSKYVVTGASAGGHLALMVGMATAEANLGPTQPNDFQIAAIVNGYGPADVNDMVARRIDFALSWLPDDTPDHDALATRVSPLTYVRQDLPPLLTVQGSNDTTVPVAEGEALHERLLAVGADAEHHLVPGAGHGFATPPTAYPEAEKTIFDFLVKHGIGN
jgi:acetyl esterase/lipase